MNAPLSFINNKIYFRIISIFLLANLELYKALSTYKKDFDVLLTVHLSIILAIDQLNAQILVL